MEQLTDNQVSGFINNGFVQLTNAFSPAIAAECRAILWKVSGCDPNNPGSWTQPVIRIGELNDEPFKRAANTPLLLNAFDQLVGKGNWIPRTSMGSFPLRFPCKTKANDTGWHVDASFAGADIGNYMEWRINIFSKGRGLLMLFLFSDVTEQDAPTRIRIGSHLDVARLLSPAGEKGLSFLELAQLLDTTKHRKETVATGKAGTVYLCHPFLVHAAQDHYGTTPKFMSQPPLVTARDFNLHDTGNAHSPVEQAIMRSLE